MIIRIAAEPAVFDPSAYRAPDLQASHTRLLDLWREVGAVSRPRREDVEKLPQNLRKRWEKALLRDRLFSDAAYRYGFEQPDGLRFVLDRLTDDLAQTVSVEVYGAVDSTEVLVSFNQLRGEFDRRWSNRGGTLSFYATEGSFFGRVRHDRYIRFDRTVWSIGRGIVVFGRTSKHTTFQMVPIDEETQDHEKRLREAQRHPLLHTRQV